MPHEKLRPHFIFDEERLNELKKITPEAFADGNINWDTLKEALGEYLEEDGPDSEHFGLFWPGKRQARKLASIPSKGTLVPVPGEGVDEDSTHNIFIEGENLEVLKLLQKSYAGRIKMIYIDPPYNTGKDFIYEDDFKEPLEEYLRRTGQLDEEGKPLSTNKRADGRFHSGWYSMIYPRLRLAMNLLRDDGVIVIHIDENEISSLEFLLKEIFGEENNLGTIVWDKRNPKGDATGIAYQHEYILCFAKNKEALLEKHDLVRKKKNAETILKKGNELFSKLGKTDLPNELKELIKRYSLKIEDFKKYEKTYSLEYINDEFAKWIKGQDFSGGERAYSMIDQNGNVYQSVSMAWPNKKSAPDDYFIPLIHPITHKECPIPERGWRFPSNSMKDLLDKNEIIFGKDETTQPRRKYLLKDNLFENIPSVIPFGGSDDALLNELKIPFDNPKPVAFVKEIIQYFTSGEDIILDFFAGSGTVGHAILELAVEGHKFHSILVQIDEPVHAKSQAAKMGFKTISEIAPMRMTKVSQKLKTENPKLIADLGFKVLKLRKSNFKQWKNYEGGNIKELEKQFEMFTTSLVDEWKEDNLMYEILIIEGFPLDSQIEKLEQIKKNQINQVTSDFHQHKLLICLDKKIEPDSINKLELNENDILICLDNAITDQNKARLSDKGLLKTI